MSDKPVCPDCGGSGEYVGLVERKPCPTCRAQSMPEKVLEKAIGTIQTAIAFSADATKDDLEKFNGVPVRDSNGTLLSFTCNARLVDGAFPFIPTVVCDVREATLKERIASNPQLKAVISSAIKIGLAEVGSRLQAAVEESAKWLMVNDESKGVDAGAFDEAAAWAKKVIRLPSINATTLPKSEWVSLPAEIPVEYREPLGGPNMVRTKDGVVVYQSMNGHDDGGKWQDGHPPKYGNMSWYGRPFVHRGLTAVEYLIPWEIDGPPLTKVVWCLEHVKKMILLGERYPDGDVKNYLFHANAVRYSASGLEQARQAVRVEFERYHADLLEPAGGGR